MKNNRLMTNNLQFYKKVPTDVGTKTLSEKQNLSPEIQIPIERIGTLA